MSPKFLFWAEIWLTNPLYKTQARDHFPWACLKLLSSLCHWQCSIHKVGSQYHECHLPWSWRMCQPLHILCFYCQNCLVQGKVLMLAKIVAFEIKEVNYGIIYNLHQTCWDSQRSAHSWPLTHHQPYPTSLMQWCFSSVKLQVVKSELIPLWGGWSGSVNLRGNISLKYYYYYMDRWKFFVLEGSIPTSFVKRL